MKTVYFHGALSERCPEPIQVVGNTIREILSALKVHPNLDPKLSNVRYEAEIDGLKSVTMLDHDWVSDEVHIQCTGKLNRLVGSGGAMKNPYVRLVVAVIIIVVAVYFGRPDVAGEAWSMYATSAISFGIAMASGALMEILAPSPDSSDESSHLASQFQNTVESGTPIAIVIGEHIWGGQYLSFNTDPENTTTSNSGAGNLGDNSGGGDNGGGSITTKEK